MNKFSQCTNCAMCVNLPARFGAPVCNECVNAKYYIPKYLDYTAFKADHHSPKPTVTIDDKFEKYVADVAKMGFTKTNPYLVYTKKALTSADKITACDVNIVNDVIEAMKTDITKKMLQDLNLDVASLYPKTMLWKDYEIKVPSVDEYLGKINIDRETELMKQAYIKNDITTTKTISAMIRKVEIKNVIYNDPATIVFWTDGTKTVVKTQKDETFDPEKGLAMAISKKFLGNKYDYYNTFLKYTKKYNKK